MKTNLFMGKAWMTVVLLPVLIFLGGCSGTPLDDADADTVTRAGDGIRVTLTAPEPANGYELGTQYTFTSRVMPAGVSPGLDPGSTLPGGSGGDYVLATATISVSSVKGNNYHLTTNKGTGYITFLEGDIYTVKATYVSDGIIYSTSKIINLMITVSVVPNKIAEGNGTRVYENRLVFGTNDGAFENLYIPFDVGVGIDIVNASPEPHILMQIPGPVLLPYKVFYFNAYNQYVWIEIDEAGTYLLPYYYTYEVWNGHGYQWYNTVTASVIRQPSLL